MGTGRVGPAVGAAVLVALAGVSVFALHDTGEVAHSAADSPAHPVASPVGHAERADYANPPSDFQPCPRARTRPAGSSRPERIPAGALRAVMCGGWTAPTLTDKRGLASLADHINALPVRHVHYACPMDASAFDYRLTFVYPGGKSVTADGYISGCGDIDLPGDRSSAGLRLGGPDIFRQYLQAALRQRSRAGADGTVTPAQEQALRCPSSGFASQGLLPEDANLGLVAAVVCRYTGTHEGLTRQGRLTGNALAELQSDYEQHIGHGSAYRKCPDGARTEIIGLSRWGDHVVLQGWCGIYLREQDAFAFLSHQTSQWTPEPATTRLIEAALRHGRP